MYPSEKGVVVVLSLKNVIYALYQEYKKKLAPHGEAGESSQMSTPPIMENIEKGNLADQQTCLVLISESISMLVVVVLQLCLQNGISI